MGPHVPSTQGDCDFLLDSSIVLVMTLAAKQNKLRPHPPPPCLNIRQKPWPHSTSSISIPPIAILLFWQMYPEVYYVTRTHRHLDIYKEGMWHSFSSQ